jgi:hypothetical protein
MANTTHPKFVRFAVLLGIVIMLNLFFFVARSFVIPEPMYEDFCRFAREPIPMEQTSCQDAGGVWMEDNTVASGAPQKPVSAGYCNVDVLYRNCQSEYDAAHKEFSMYAFATMVGLGILSIVVGVLPIGSSIVSSGLSYGGVLAFIVAAIQYWGEADNLLRLAISFIALVALLYIGVKRFKDEKSA